MFAGATFTGDLFVSKAPEARVALETLATTNRVVLAGEVRGPEGLGHDELIETARQGAVPMMKGADTIGFFAVSGAPGGDKDEVCVRAVLAKIAGKY